MKHTAEKKPGSLMKRRVCAIVISAVALLLLIVAMIFVLQYADITEVPDKDGTIYYIRKSDGLYALYDGDKNLMPTEEQFGYYVTYLGTLIDVDAQTGEYEIVALVDTADGETYAANTRIMIFPSVSKQNILSIEVHNDKGGFTFCRYNQNTGKFDASGDFIILGAPMTSYDQDLFATMYVSAGYTMTTDKVIGPVDENGNPSPPIKRDENGALCTHTEACSCDYKEYGLVPGTKYDEEGKPYDYEPAYYILTDIYGNRHKLLIGDALVDGSGYYVQYVDISGESEVKRDAVYVVDTDMGTTMLAAIEEYVDPTLTYPMTSTTYFDVQDFTIDRRKDKESEDEEAQYENVISFSYVDLDLRENTLSAAFPFTFNLDMKGYMPNGLQMEACLSNLYEPEYVKVCKLLPTVEDLAEYGFYQPKQNEDGSISYVQDALYTISFKHTFDESEGTEDGTLYQIILVAQNPENGNYYTYTTVNALNPDGSYEYLYSFDTILEISRHSLDFLTWDRYDWITDTYIEFDIAYIESIKLESPSYSATFDTDNSLSDMSDGINANNMSVTASDSTGQSLETLGAMTLVDIYNSTWIITPTEIIVYDAQGNTRSLAAGVGYYSYNAVDRQVLSLKDGNHITCQNMTVEVTPNYVYITYNNGKIEKIARYGTHVFWDFYTTMRYASIIDDYPLSAEEEAELIGNAENWITSITITTKDTDGTTDTNVYSFYRISAHKAYIAINGRGGFCVKMNRVNKFITDAQKFMNLEPIDPTAKY